MSESHALRPNANRHVLREGSKATEAEENSGYLAPAAEAPVQPEEAEEDGEELTAVREARVPQTLTSPDKPSEKEVCEHNLTHLPYRNWCPVCVAAAGREGQHRRRKDAVDEGEVPTVGMDYNFFGDGAEDVTAHSDEVKAIVVKDFRTGMIWAHRVTRKGPQDKWAVKKVVADIESLGRSEIKLKTDGEPAITSLQSAVIAARVRPSVTIPVNPPAYDPQANGTIEKGVQDVNTQERKTKLALEARIGETIPADHPVMEWGLEHSAFTLCRCAVGQSGKAPWEKLTGARWRGRVV
jgi:hypothetical protein